MLPFGRDTVPLFISALDETLAAYGDAVVATSGQYSTCRLCPTGSPGVENPASRDELIRLSSCVRGGLCVREQAPWLTCGCALRPRTSHLRKRTLASWPSCSTRSPCSPSRRARCPSRELRPLAALALQARYELNVLDLLANLSSCLAACCSSFWSQNPFDEVKGDRKEEKKESPLSSGAKSERADSSCRQR